MQTSPVSSLAPPQVGAGIGDHTTFFLDRGCEVVVTEGRPENFAVLRQRYPQLETHLLDMEVRAGSGLGGASAA